MKAVGLILDNPLGIGAAIFTRFYHHEEVHNVYLSMFLNAGWVGGLLYLMTCLGTLAFGFRHVLKKTPSSPLFLIVFSALAGNICEGVLIDSDHWRHFYLLLALVWGMMAADQRQLRPARILARFASGSVAERSHHSAVAEADADRRLCADADGAGTQKQIRGKNSRMALRPRADYCIRECVSARYGLGLSSGRFQNVGNS